MLYEGCDRWFMAGYMRASDRWFAAGYMRAVIGGWWLAVRGQWSVLGSWLYEGSDRWFMVGNMGVVIFG